MTGLFSTSLRRRPRKKVDTDVRTRLAVGAPAAFERPFPTILAGMAVSHTL
jgi:hypothetical protein